METRQYRGYYIDIVYSQYDSGYYCQVWDRQGKDVFQGEICNSEIASLKEAKAAIERR